MQRNSETRLAWFVCVGLLAAALPVWALDEDEALGFERTPPRLSLTDGEVSFWRAGAEEWTPARRNIALAEGDQLWTSESANLELQIAERTYVRAGENTQLVLTSLEPDYVQLRVTTGHVSLDLRSRKTGQTIELATPNAAFTIEHTGYYRVEVDGESTRLISRRGGSATVTTAAGETVAIAASEQVVVTGTDAPQVETHAAPEIDAWDRWNYARTSDQLDADSSRYVSSGVYGVDDLDHYGEWRVVETYGRVWVPSGVAVGWVPYSTGLWMYDPFYGWTWVDDAPWGWAPYHYGRWVHVSGYWGWAPGPFVVRPYYAPALVAFYGGHRASFSFSLGGPPHLGWVALGWGEPIIPWWGPVGCRGVPRWAGWRGPRVVNNVVVNNTTVINAREVNVFQNARVDNAIVAVDRRHFGRGPIAEARLARGRAEDLAPIHELDVKPDRRSFAAGDGDAHRPPREAMSRRVVATREARREARASEFHGRRAAPETQLEQPEGADRSIQSDGHGAAPPARIVTPKRGGRDAVSEHSPFGKRHETERQASPPGSHLRDSQRASRRGVEHAPAPRGIEAPAGPDAPAARGHPAERPQDAVERPGPGMRGRSRDHAPPTPRGVERRSVRRGAEHVPAPTGIEAPSGDAPAVHTQPAEPPQGAMERPSIRGRSRNDAPPTPRGVGRHGAPHPAGGGEGPERQREPEVSVPSQDPPGEPANPVFQPHRDRDWRGADRGGAREHRMRGGDSPWEGGGAPSPGGGSRGDAPGSGGGPVVDPGPPVGGDPPSVDAGPSAGGGQGGDRHMDRGDWQGGGARMEGGGGHGGGRRSR